MLWCRSKASLHTSVRWRLRRALGSALLAVAVVVAVQGYKSALATLERTQLFMSAARVVVPSEAVGSGGEQAASPAHRRRFDRPLDLDEARAASNEDVVRIVQDAPGEEAARGHPGARRKHPLVRRHLAALHNHTGPTYRTVCVRLCDGAYFPISYATTPAHFRRDAEACSAQCGSPSRLYVYRSGAGPEAMRDLAGQPYIALPTAFAYRQSRKSQCTCKPQPWDEAAIERHRMYDLEAKAAAGHVAAARELALLRAVTELRDTAPDASLASLGEPAQAPPVGYANQSGKLAFGPPVVAPLDESTIRSAGPIRYAGELHPLSVVLDATGSPVRRHVHHVNKPMQLQILARVTEAPAHEALAVTAAASTSQPAAAVPAPAAARAVAAHGMARKLTALHAKVAERRRLAALALDEDEGAEEGATVGERAAEASGEGASQSVADPTEPAPRATRTAGHGKPAHKVTRRTAAQPIHGKQNVAARRQPARPGGARVARADPKPDWRELLFRPY